MLPLNKFGRSEILMTKTHCKVFCTGLAYLMMENVLCLRTWQQKTTETIQTSLLRAGELGQQQLDTFVQDRLVGTEPDGQTKVSIHETLAKNRVPKFSSLYDVVGDSKEKDEKTIFKADRNILQRLVTSYEAGRSVDLPAILKHEPMPVPVSLTEMNGALRDSNKSMLAGILTEGIVCLCPKNIDLHAESSCLIDWKALVNEIGKPVDDVTCGDLADTFFLPPYFKPDPGIKELM